MTHYIFGYGSLMNSSSRKLTGNTGNAIPAVVSGLVRYWGKVDETYIASPLVVDRGDGIVNGVLLPLSQDQLSEFDIRERGYQRISVSPSQVTTDVALQEEDTIWVYIKPRPEAPTSNMPILQTYIDTVLSGCLEISDAFADLFIQHTIGWQHPIENDRHQPKYGNYAGVSQHHQLQIDEMLVNVISC